MMNILHLMSLLRLLTMKALAVLMYSRDLSVLPAKCMCLLHDTGARNYSQAAHVYEAIANSLSEPPTFFMGMNTFNSFSIHRTSPGITVSEPPYGV